MIFNKKNTLFILLFLLLFGCQLSAPVYNMPVKIENITDLGENQIKVDYTVYSYNLTDTYSVVEIYIKDVNKKEYIKRRGFTFEINKYKSIDFSDVIITEDIPDISTLRIFISHANYL